MKTITKEYKVNEFKELSKEAKEVSNPPEIDTQEGETMDSHNQQEKIVIYFCW